MRLLRGLFMFLSILAILAMLVSAYAGNVSPLKNGGTWGILPLCLEPCMAICLLLMILQLGWHWRGVVSIAIGYLACAGPCLDVCPLNVHIGERKAPEGGTELTLMTYNVLGFHDQREGVETEENAVIDYILASDADIVCLQESGNLAISKGNKITAKQMEKLHAKYKEIVMGGSSQTVFSKYPITPIHIVTTREEFNDADVNAFRVGLPGGKTVTVFNVHLQSFMLTQDDRRIYREITTLKEQPIRDVKTQLFDKLRFANVERARQAQALLRFIRHYGGPNVIVCGDFNDVSTSYAIRTLEDAGLREVYPELGFGPIITYNASRLYFGIDHVLYKGDIVPLAISRGNIKASDHYPVTVKLAVE